MWKGVRWQERFGLRKLFRIYIVVGAVVGMAQYAAARSLVQRDHGRAVARAAVRGRAAPCASGFSALNIALVAAGDAADSR